MKIRDRRINGASAGVVFRDSGARADIYAIGGGSETGVRLRAICNRQWLPLADIHDVSGAGSGIGQADAAGTDIATPRKAGIMPNDGRVLAPCPPRLLGISLA